MRVAVKKDIRKYIEKELQWGLNLDVEFLLNIDEDAEINIFIIPLSYTVHIVIHDWYGKRKVNDYECNLNPKKDTYLFNNEMYEKLRDFAYKKDKYSVERIGHKFTISSETKEMLEDISKKNRVDVYNLYDILLDTLMYHIPSNIKRNGLL